MSQTTYFIPVPFARFQDPIPRSDAPTSGAGNPGAAGGAPQAGGEQGAQQQTPGGAPQGPCSDPTMLVMGPVFLALMYFMIMRPEKKRKQEQQALLSSIKQGDQVVTISGMHGIVSALTDKTVTLRVDTVNMTFDRTAVARIEREPSADDAGKQGS